MGFRREKLTRPVFEWARRALPPISPTEAEAIEAGTVWFDGEIFAGTPDWSGFLSMAPARLSAEEQRFLDGPVETLLGMLDEWKLASETRDLSPKVWDFLKRERFFGMVIPKRYGGLGFSNAAHSEVVRKVSTASVVLGVTVMVPNSLGPGELMLHFGTDVQREHWLPRLADGREVPCFGLTSLHAGSDAAAMRDRGVVAWGEIDGERVLGIRLTFAKRYITLAPVATVMGLAFKLEDPDDLLGQGARRGITVALIPMNTPGVVAGDRHLPQSTYFQNGPIEGRDVFVPMSAVLGGPERIGEGWRMLMTALSAGRGISLPSQAAAACAFAARTTGAYAGVRRQFGLPLAAFEGIQEQLAELAANAYVVDAARHATVAALDAGHRPAVISAVMKAHATARMRDSLTRAMDVHGGKAVIDGPRNYLSAHYKAVPIGITVEGANILTRSLMIFGQGAIRAHPFMLKEMRALADPDRARGLDAFDRHFWGHVGHALRNAGRALFRGWTGGLAGPKPNGAAFSSHWRQLSRLSAAFALVCDLSLLTLGGDLKRREMLSGRLGDILAEIYLLAAALKRFETEGRPEADKPLVEYVAQRSFFRLGIAFRGVLDNLPARWAAGLARLLAFPYGVPVPLPPDDLTAEAAAVLSRPSMQRDRLAPDVFVGNDDHPLRQLENAFALAAAVAPVERRMREAGLRDPAKAVEAGAISGEEAEALRAAADAADRVCAVDSFPPEEVSPLAARSATGTDEMPRAAAE